MPASSGRPEEDSQTLELREFVCPQCHASTRLDPRFAQWCPDCGHGADPNPPRPGCAAELGCRVPDHVFFGTRFNAATGRLGPRRGSFLLLGLPLWTVLPGQQRIALLGHELAHQINGDTTHGLWASSARRSLTAWTRLLDPRQTAAERRHNRMTAGRGFGGMAALLAPVATAVLFAPFFLAALGCRALLTRLDLYCGQRAEYLADELSARLAGSEAVYGCLSASPLGAPVQGFLTAARNRSTASRDGAAEELWASVARYVESVPETERQRRTIVDRLHNARTDRSHPANHLRIALIRDRAQLPAALTLSDAEWAEIDAELAPRFLLLARAFLKG